MKVVAVERDFEILSLPLDLWTYVGNISTGTFLELKKELQKKKKSNFKIQLYFEKEFNKISTSLNCI